MKRTDGITLIAIWHYFVAALFVIGACFMVLVPIIVGLVPDTDAAMAWPIVAIVSVVVIVVLLAFGAAFGAIGLGLWRLKPWARLGAMLTAGLSLLAVPLGTIVGGLTLWYLFQPEAREAFGQ
jgi:hypothetical protein